ncbi:MAG TPA: iron-containing alcohol dehydrogenase [Patescibacteria group bacterium]|nr:iron-containing alcohol dehydrogenase [Patescibacteria group bacterium]
MDNQRVNPDTFEFFMSPISIIGNECLDRVISYIKPMRLGKALIVTDHFLYQSGVVNPLLELLQRAGLFCVLYDEVKPNPTVENVNFGLKLYRDNGCDFLISFGGGSPHDCAKAIALLATNGGKIEDYEGVNKLRNPSATLVAINTTAGTGSELTRFCVITDEERRVKMAISDWHITPCIAVNDVALMMDMPPGLTAATGMDALTHAIEAYVSSGANPVTDCKALKAVELVAGNLRTAVKDGHNREARMMMVYASYLAGIAFNNSSLGYVHAAAHQLGGFYNLPHGLCNALMLPAVVAYNASAAPDKYADIARAFGIKNDAPGNLAEKLVSAIRSLAADIGIPKGLREVKGFNEKDIPLLSANALKDVCALTNPRQGEARDMEEIFRISM